MKLEEKKTRIRRIIIILISVNLFLFLVKWIPTLFSSSISVRADAFNSLGDFAYSGLLLLGFEILLRPKDSSHPHGHERFEPFISLIIAGAIGLTGVLIVRQAVQSIFASTYSFNYYFILALGTSAALKYGLSIFLKKKADEIDSTALLSSSEDAKTDVLASITAMVGVIGAWRGILLLDTIIGLVVSVWIFKTAYSIGKKNFEFLTGASAPQKVLSRIKEILDNENEIISYHDLEAHYVGPEVHVSLSIHLPEELNFDELHDIEENLKKKISSIKEIDAVYLHLEPENSKEID